MPEQSHQLWTAPASLLIGGEYQITEEGGRGISLASRPRARLLSTPGMPFAIKGIWPGGGFNWKAGEPPGEEMPDFLFREMANLEISITSPRTILKLDTSDFFYPDGSKSGYGSSAASAVLLAAAVLTLCTDKTEDTAMISHLALNTHRAFQRGRGSGYDILTSLHGGCGLFTGGTEPGWIPLEWPSDIEAWLLKGGKPVNSRQAVERYSEWKKDRPDAAMNYRKETRSLMDYLLSAMRSKPGGNGAEFIQVLKELAILGRRLGKNIGVPAEPVLPGVFSRQLQNGCIPGLVAKCLGAGDELVLLAGARDTLPEEDRNRILEMESAGTAQAVLVDPEGLKRKDLV